MRVRVTRCSSSRRVGVIEFQTLGQLNLSNPATGAPYNAVLTRSKRLALFSFLALARPRGFHRRSLVTGMFWPDSSEAKARRALNQALYVLRTGLGSGVIVARGDDEIGLDPDRVTCDAWLFEESLEIGEVERAMSLYGGPLLNGFYLPDSLEFEQWLDVQRTRYERLAIDAAVTLASTATSLDQAQNAGITLRRMLADSPHEESLALSLIRLLARCGHRASALQAFDDFKSQLANELGMQPSQRLLELVESVRDGADEAEGAKLASTTPRTLTSINDQPGDPTGPAPSVGLAREDAKEVNGKRRSGFNPARSVALPPVLAAVLLILGGAVLALMLARTTASGAPDAGRILVLPLENATGEARLDGLSEVAADWVSSGLVQTGLIEVVSPVDVKRWNRSLAGERHEDRLGRSDLAHEISRRTDAGLLLTGELRVIGDSLRLLAQISDVNNGTLLQSVESTTVPIDKPMQAADDLRERVIGALATMVDSRFAAWARAASPPPSLRAYQLYAEGKDLYARDRPGQASKLFSLAASHDTAFTSARVWAAMGAMAAWYAEGSTDSQLWSRADSILRSVERQSDGLPAWDLAMARLVRAQLERDTHGALDAIRRVNELTPDSEWLLNQAGLATIMDRPSEALAILSGIDPDLPWFERRRNTYWLLKLRNLHRLERYRDELDEVRRIRGVENRETAARWSEFRAVLALGDQPRAEELFDSFVLFDNELVSSAFMELTAHGYDELALQPVERAIVAQFEVPEEERGHRWRLNTARYLMLLESYDEALDILHLFERGDDGYFDAQGEIGYVEAVRGNRDIALQIINALAEAPDRDFALFQRARIAAELGDRAKAVQLLNQMRILGYLHPEAYLPNLVGFPPFEQWRLPKG